MKQTGRGSSGRPDVEALGPAFPEKRPAVEGLDQRQAFPLHLPIEGNEHRDIQPRRDKQRGRAPVTSASRRLGVRSDLGSKNCDLHGGVFYHNYCNPTGSATKPGRI